MSKQRLSWGWLVAGMAIGLVISDPRSQSWTQITIRLALGAVVLGLVGVLVRVSRRK